MKTFWTGIFLIVLCLLMPFLGGNVSAQTITSLNHNHDDQSLIVFMVSDEITSAPNYNGFSVTIDGTPATFQNSAPTQLAPLTWVVNLVQVIMPGQTVRFEYNAGPGNVTTSAGALASEPLTIVQNTRTIDCTDFTNSGQFNVYISGVCTPIDKIQQYQGLMKLAMANSVNFDPNKLLVRFDWNDEAGNYDFVPVSTSSVDPLTGYEFRAQEQHTYPKENPCGYYVTMTPGYDMNGDGDLDDPVDFICAKGMNDDVVAEESIPFPAWETDEENTGTVQLDPLQIDHCINVPMDTLFNDATNYNCRIAALDNPPIVDDTAYANLRRRYVRMTYGTNAGRKIPNIYVNGVKVTDQNGNFTGAVVPNIFGGYEDPAGAILIPRTYPFTEQMLLQSLRITMPNPGYEVIGDVFEITLENWNICNPYSPGPGSYTNSIKRTARILIVGSEDPTGPVDGVYCDGEAVPAIRVNDNPWGSGNYVVWYDDFDPHDPSVGNQLYSSAPGQSGILIPPDTITAGTTVSYWAAYEGECPSENRIEVTLTKHPKPVGLDVPAGTYIICSEDPVNINPQMYTDLPGSSFTWSGNNGTSGTGNIVDTPPNTTNNEINVTYTVVPTGPPPASCPGDPFTIVVTVQPKPIVTPGLNQLVCSGDPANLVLTFDNSLTGGATFFWNAPPVTTGGMTPGPSRPDPGSGAPITDLYNNPTASNQTATYMVTGVSTASGCYGDPETVLITIVPEFTPSNDQAIADNTLCYNDDPGIISGSPPVGGTGVYTYQWQSSPDASAWTDIAGATGASYNPGPVTADIFFRRLEFSGPCLGISNEVFLDVTPELFPGVINPDQVICFGDTPNDITGTTASGGEGTGTYSYQWQQSTDNIAWADLADADANFGEPVDVTAPALSFAGPLPASTWFRRIVVSGECTAISNVVFIQSALAAPPKPVIDIGVADLCEGSVGITYGISTPDPLDDPNGYTWNYDDGLPVATYNQMKSINYDFPSSGIVTITVTASNGCGDGPVSDPYVVTVYQQPVADAGGPVAPDQCGPDFTFNATPSVGTGQWTLDSGPGTVTGWGSGQDQPDATATVSVYGTYSFVWTESNGPCIDSDTISVTFWEQPTASLSGNDDVCNLLEYTLSASPYSYLGPPNVKSTSRTWTLESAPPGGGIVSILPDAADPNPTVTVNLFGNDIPYVFRWTETNGSCSDYGEIMVYFREQPVSDAGTDDEICGVSYDLAANIPAVGTGTWSVVSQPAGSTVSFGSANDEINDNDAKAIVDVFGIYEFQWTVNNGPCMAADIVQITYHEPAVVTTGPGQVIAEGAVSAPLGGSVSGGVSTGSWAVVSGVPGGTFLPNFSDLNAVFDPSALQEADGWVVLRLTSADPPGICPPAWADVNISINEMPEVLITSPADGAQFCAGEVIDLAGEFGGSATEATWSSGGTGSFSQSYFNATPFTTVYTPSAADTAAGSVMISLTSDDPDGAGPATAASMSINVILKAIPVTSPISGPQEVCTGTGPFVYRVDGTTGTPLSTYAWSISPIDGNEPVLNQAGNVSVLEFGPNSWSGTITVVETTLGCSNAGVSLDISSVGIPVADAGPDKRVCSDVPVMLGGSPSATGGSGSYLFAWTPDIDIDDPAIANPSVIISNSTGVQMVRNYQLVVTDMLTGCVSLPQEVEIRIDPKPILAPDLNNTVCSQMSAGIILSTTAGSIPAAIYDISLNGQDAGLTGTPTTGAGLLNSAIQNDSYLNRTSANQGVIYDVVPISAAADGECRGNVTPVRLMVRPEPILRPDLGNTVCSEEPVNIILETTSGSTPALLYEVSLNLQDPALTGTPTTGTGMPNLIQNDIYMNIGASQLQVVYEAAPISSYGCRGEATPVNVFVDPQPVMDPDLDRTVCSGEPSGIVFSTNGISVDADRYNVVSITISSLLIPGSGNLATGTDLPATAVESDIFHNTSIFPASVVYRVRPVSAASCIGDPEEITLTIMPEPFMNAGITRTVCSNEATGLLLSTAPVSLAADHYDVISITADPFLVPGSGNAVVMNGVMADVFANDVFENRNDSPGNVYYEVVPVSASGCRGEPVIVQVIVNPEPVMASDLDNTVCSGIPSGIFLATGGMLPAGHFNLVSINADPDLQPDTGNGTTGNNKTADEIAGDIFINLTNEALEVVYEVVPVSSEGCEGLPELITLTVNPQPVVQPGLDQVVCSGLNTGITLETTGSSVTAGSWNIIDIVEEPGVTPSAVNSIPGDGQLSDAIFNDQFMNSGNTPGTVTYSLIPVSTDGCEGDMEMIEVTVNPVPEVTSTVTDESICNGENFDFTLMTGTAPAGNVHFDYSVSASSEVTGYTSPVTGLTNGVQVIGTLHSTSLIPEPVVYTVIPYYQSCEGLPLDITYTVNPSPAAEISGGGQICQGDTAWITFTLTGTPPFSLTYETDLGIMTTIEDITDPVHTIGVNPMRDTNYRIISVYDGNGSSCNGNISGQADVLVRETPVASFNVDPLDGCAPLMVHFDNFSTGNMDGPATGFYYRIEGQTDLTRFSDDLYASYEFNNTTSAPIIYETVFIAESSEGCADRFMREITVNPAVRLDVAANDPLEGCNDYTVTFTNNQILPGILYIWEWGDGEMSDTTTVEASVSHTFFNPSTVSQKTFNVRVSALDPATGCEETAIFPVRISPDIVLELEVNTTEGCSPLTVNAINRSGGVQNHTWYYRVKGTAERMEEVNTSNVIYQLRNSTTGLLTYELVYTGRNIYGCQESDTLEVSVWPELHADFIASPERQVLPNSTVTIQDLTNEGPWDYTWMFGDGNSSNDPDLDEYDYDTYGIFQIVLEVVTGPCVSSTSQMVTIEPITPIVDFDAVPREGCSPLTVDFINKSKYADPTTYFWEFGDNVGYSNAENPSFTFYEPGVYSVSLEASNELGIVVRQEYEMFITVYETPIAQFRVRPSTVYVPDQPVYTSNLSYGATQFFWDFGDADGIDDTSTEEEPYYYYTNPGVYDIYLWVSNEDGCEDSVLVYKAVIAEPGGELATPNVFTPSLDGPNGGDPGNVAFNDVFLPFEKGAAEFHMQIFNRWGELLFESYDKNIGWDGYYKGRLAKSDVYIYRLDLKLNDGRRVTKLGDVFLLR